MNLSHLPVKDHFGNGPAHEGEIRRDGGKPSKDDFIKGELVVGYYKDVAAYGHSKPGSLLGQDGEVGLKLAVQEDECVSTPEIAGYAFEEFHGNAVFARKTADWYMYQTAVKAVWKSNHKKS